FRLLVLNPLTRNIECVKKKKTNCLLSKVHKPQKYSIFKSERRESRVLSAEYSKSKTKNRKSVNKNGRKVDNNQPTGVVKYNLTNFRLQRILNNNTRNKKQSDTDKAVVIFEKQDFRESEVATESEQSEKQFLEKNCENNVKDNCLMSYFRSDLKVQTELINDVYGNYQCVVPVELSALDIFSALPSIRMERRNGHQYKVIATLGLVAISLALRLP
uniref:Uncharacterized protein n=1 Tax=Glossina palpalis gambiensis TaxID=67801 RepID=A0A1B0C6S0_9MUSC